MTHHHAVTAVETLDIDILTGDQVKIYQNDIILLNNSKAIIVYTKS